MKIAIDVDDTITSHPEAFKVLAESLKKIGAHCSYIDGKWWKRDAQRKKTISIRKAV